MSSFHFFRHKDEQRAPKKPSIPKKRKMNDASQDTTQLIPRKTTSQKNDEIRLEHQQNDERDAIFGNDVDECCDLDKDVCETYAKL